MLRSFGCLITFAATTEEAMRALKQGQEQARPFHLILSDISRQLPTQDPISGLIYVGKNAGKRHYATTYFLHGTSRSPAQPFLLVPSASPTVLTSS